MNEQEVLSLVARAFQQLAEGQKASGTPAGYAPLYGSGGLFGRCDGPSMLVNAMVGPIGVESKFQWIGNDTEREFVDTLTQIQESGSEQSTACGDCVTVYQKACAQFYCFGRFCRQTPEEQFDNIGLRANAQVPVKTLFGAITDASGAVLVPMGETISDSFYLMARSAGYALRFKNSQLIWTGNPANNAGSYAEYNGLEQIVNTGKFDAYTQLTCTALDSFLQNFGSNNPQSAGTYAIQSWFRRAVGQLMRRAGGANMDWTTANMFIVMSDNMWDCVARTYACTGMDLCEGLSASAADARVMNQSADQALNRYEQYTSQMQLPIYGRNYPVVLDTQLTETTGQPNGVCSDIYFLTEAINGETILYGEYQDFNRTYGRVHQEMRAMFASDDIAITDNGRYAVIRDNVRGCFDIQILTKPRLVALAPWLCARIQNVCCNVGGDGTPYPDPTLSGTVYEPGCGRTTTPIPTLYGSCPETLS